MHSVQGHISGARINCCFKKTSNICKIYKNNYYRTGKTIISGLYDLITGAASRVVKTYVKSAPTLSELIDAK